MFPVITRSVVTKRCRSTDLLSEATGTPHHLSYWRPSLAAGRGTDPDSAVFRLPLSMLYATWPRTVVERPTSSVVVARDRRASQAAVKHRRSCISYSVACRNTATTSVPLRNVSPRHHLSTKLYKNISVHRSSCSKDQSTPIFIFIISLYIHRRH